MIDAYAIEQGGYVEEAKRLDAPVYIGADDILRVTVKVA
jgi:hypothetical protein